MAIIKGFKSFEKYVKTSDENNQTKYQLMSERQLAKDVLLKDGTSGQNNVENAITIINQALPYQIVIDDNAKTINFIDR